MIIKDKEKVPLLNSAGIYSIPTIKNNDITDQGDDPHSSVTPDKFYISSTKRSIKTRLNEHMNNGAKKIIKWHWSITASKKIKIQTGQI